MGFEITATYPINSDLHKFIGGEAVSFDIVIVARPINERSPTSWDSLRRQIVRTAKETYEILEENRDLSGRDIGVIEMGKCFQEYSKHHGEIRGSEAGMTAKQVVEEIYGVIQGGDEGERDVFIDLLDADRPTYNDLNKLLRRPNASEESMRETRLFRMAGNDLILGTWDDKQRQAYIQRKVNEAGRTAATSPISIRPSSCAVATNTTARPRNTSIAGRATTSGTSVRASPRRPATKPTSKYSASMPRSRTSSRSNRDIPGSSR